MNMVLINSIIKMFFIILYSILIFSKLLNRKKHSKIELIAIIIGSAIISIIYSIIKKYSNTILAFYILCILISFLIRFINKDVFSILAVIISIAICIVCWGAAVILEYVFYIAFNINNSLINNILISIIELILIINLFKIKRLKNGLTFLKNRVDNQYINIIMLNISAIIIVAYCIVGNYYGNLTRQLIIGFVMLGLIMIIMIQKILTFYYKQNLLNKTIEEYKKEIKEKDQKIQELSNEKFNISKLNHEFYNRQKALELKVKELMLETGEEIGILDRINNLTKEYSDNLQNLRSMPKLQLTDITEIDDMFKYMQEECYKSNIDFKLQIEGNIYYLINNIISKNKLETLIGDHIKDAIIAINSSNNKYKSIFVILGIKNNHYELCVYDTGKEFDIEVLLKLGLEPITSHRETGGSGIGFITTFETLKECKASLIIEEYNLDTTDYTKSVIIRFDNRNEYKIRTYRAEEIRKRSKDNRIIIENI